MPRAAGPLKRGGNDGGWSRAAHAMFLALAHDPSHALASPARMRLFRIVSANPGLTLRQLATRAGATWGTTKYHVMRLEAAGLVTTVAVAGKRVCLPADAALGAPVQARAMLAEPTARMIAIFLVAHPGTSIARIIEGTGLSKRAAYYHVKKLIEHGLARLEPGFGYRRLHPTPALYDALV